MFSGCVFFIDFSYSFGIPQVYKLSSRLVRYFTLFLQVICDRNSYTKQEADFADESRKVRSNLWGKKKPRYCCTIAQVLEKE